MSNAKKQKNLDAKLDEKESLKQDAVSDGVLVKDVKNSKQDKQDKKAKDDKKKDKKKKDKEKKGGLVKKTKETVSELKKVTWPTFGEVVKKTSIVVAFVLIFGVFLFAVNWLLGGLVNLLMGNSFFG